MQASRDAAPVVAVGADQRDDHRAGHRPRQAHPAAQIDVVSPPGRADEVASRQRIRPPWTVSTRATVASRARVNVALIDTRLRARPRSRLPETGSYQPQQEPQPPRNDATIAMLSPEERRHDRHAVAVVAARVRRPPHVWIPLPRAPLVAASFVAVSLVRTSLQRAASNQSILACSNSYEPILGVLAIVPSGLGTRSFRQRPHVTKTAWPAVPGPT